jgi:hypothetical protein
MQNSRIQITGPTQAQREAALADVKRFLGTRPTPLPEESLRLLYEAACHDTGGSQAARNFLFWLAGQPDPTGFAGDGGLELRRFDHELKSAALEIMRWWAGPTKSDSPGAVASFLSAFPPGM